MPALEPDLTRVGAPSPGLDSNYKWQVVGMLWLTGFFNYADRQAIFSLFPLLQTELHLNMTQLGLLGTSFAFVYGICGPLAGNVVDRVRRRFAILGGLFAWSLICMATAQVRTFRSCSSSARLRDLARRSISRRQCR